MVFRPDDCNATWIPEPDFSTVKPGDHMSFQSLWYALTDRAARRGGPGENGPGQKQASERIAATIARHRNSPTTSPLSQNSLQGWRQ